MNILVTIVVTLAKWMNFWKNKGLPTPGHSCSRRSQCTTSAIPSPPATSSPPPSLPFALIRASPGHVCGHHPPLQSPPPCSRPLARTALRVRTVNLRDFGGSDEGLANLAEQFHENNYRRRWVSLSRSVDSDCSSSCSSASPLSPSGSVSDHSDCSDLGSEGCWETDSDVG